MRKLLMMAALFLVVATMQAQPGQRAGQDRKTDPFAGLELSAEQKAQLQEIRTETQSKLQALRAESAGQRPDRAARKEIMEASREKMDAILTPAQRNQLADQRKGRKEAWESVDKEALKSDLKEHRREVMAVVKAARAQLDEFISSEDQATIEQLRAVMSTRPKMERRRRGGQAVKPDPEQRAAQREIFENWRNEHEADLAQLSTLTEKYAADIERIHEKLKPQVREWQEEKKAIFQSYFPAEHQQRRPAADKGKRRIGKRGKGEKAAGGAKQPHKGAKFLLLQS